MIYIGFGIIILVTGAYMARIVIQDAVDEAKEIVENDEDRL